MPPYVEREFRRYLECGVLAHDFARARCGQCGHDLPVALSCQGRGVCPSCNARRMVATATHLTDHVLPALPVRQWVLAVPKRLRYFLQRDADLQGAALRLLLRAVESCLRAHSPGSGPAARLGAVAFIHRFGSTLNAHLHFHCVVIDGVFDAAPTGGVIFRAVTALTPATAPTPPPEPPAAEPAHRRAARYAWAMLLARIYEVFPLVCPLCGAEMRIIAFLTDPVAMRAILAHSGLRVRPALQRVATTVTVAAHPCATPGALVPA